MRELLSNNSLFVGQLHEDKSLELRARELIFFTTDLQTVNYERCSKNNVICALFRRNHVVYTQNLLVLIDLSLARDTGEYLFHTFTGLGMVYIVS